MLAVHRREQVGEAADRLGRAQHEVAIGPQRVVQEGHDALLQRRAEVDQDVAAAHQVEPRERGVPGEVVPREHAHLADRLADLIATVDAHEIAAQQIGRERRGDGLRVDPGARSHQVSLVDVGGEDFQRPSGFLGGDHVEQRHGQAVSLFAGGAPGHPDPDRRVGPPGPHDARQDLRAQGRERGGVAKELRHHDEDVVVEGGDLVGVAAQKRDVFVEAVDRVEQHAAPDAPADGGELVVGEIDAEGAAQDLEDGLEQAGVGPREAPQGLCRLGFGDVGVASDPGQLPRDRLGRKDEIDDVRRDRALRHARVLGRLGILGERHAARGLDRGEPPRAVRCRARQDHADGLFAALLGK